MTVHDPLADHVTLEFEVHVRCLFVDQPQRAFGVARDDDARHVIAERILRALADALPEMLDGGVSYPNRDGGRNAHGWGEMSSLGDLP